jgi:hypothetical protein
MWGTKGNRAISPPATETVVTIYLALAGWHSNLSAISDNSTFVHLRTGQWMLTHGLPHSDVFSFTAAATPWVPESWLADLLYGLIDSVSGPWGLLFLNAIIGAAIGALWFRLARRLSRDLLRATVIAMASLAASYTLWSPRPLMMGMLAFLALVYLVEAPDSAPGRHPMLLIPPLFWIWANTHGSFVLGFVYVGLHLAGRWLEGRQPWREREADLLTATAIGLAVCFINPYGYRLLTAPFYLLSRYQVLSHVIEWRPAGFTSLQGGAYLVWLTVFAAAMLMGSRNPGARGWLVSLSFIALGFSSERNIAIVPIVTFPIAARAWAAPAPRAPQPVAFNWVMVAIAALLTISWSVAALRRPALNFKNYPVAAMQAIGSHGLLGQRLLAPDIWGGFIVLNYGPGQRVFMDDRYDVYPPAIADDMYALVNGRGNWLQVVRQYGIDVVVWPVSKKSVRVLAKTPEWRKIYSDKTAIVISRISAGRPQVPKVPTSAAFPGR